MAQARIPASLTEDPLIVTRHMGDNFANSTIISGARNRWLTHPGTLTKSESESTASMQKERVISALAEAVRRHDKFWEMSDETTVDWYGQCMVDLPMSSTLPYNATIADKLAIAPESEQDLISLEEMKIAAFADKEWAQVVGTKFHADLTTELNTRLEDLMAQEWLDKIKLLAWQDTPVVDGSSNCSGNSAWNW